MKLIFCGTPQFAVPALERLLVKPFEVELVVTNPDEPSGRGYEVKFPAVKRAALDAGLVLFQPSRLKDPFARGLLSQFRPDVIVVVAYGHIIPGWMIELPRLGCINLHASLLPKYRGAAPIPWAIMRAEQVTGVTTMKIDEGLDTGDILLQREIEIRPDDTAETLGARMSLAGAELMGETLERLCRGELRGRPQDHARATLAPMLKKEDGRIDWSLSAAEIERRVRGLRPWPGAFTLFRQKHLHLWTASVAGKASRAEEPGTLAAGNGKLRVACGDAVELELLEVQLEGRRRLSGSDFLNGVHLQGGERLGS